MFVVLFRAFAHTLLPGQLPGPQIPSPEPDDQLTVQTLNSFSIFGRLSSPAAVHHSPGSPPVQQLLSTQTARQLVKVRLAHETPTPRSEGPRNLPRHFLAVKWPLNESGQRRIRSAVVRSANVITTAYERIFERRSGWRSGFGSSRAAKNGVLRWRVGANDIRRIDDFAIFISDHSRDL